MNSEKKGFLRKLISVLTTIVIVMTSFQYQGLTAQAASHKLSAKAYTSSHIVTYHWKGSAKFGSGKGLDYIKENACVLLHYLDGDLGQCVYAEQDTPEGAAKEFNVKNDERTSWMYEEKAGYDKYKYVGLAQEYLITKKVSLSGITNSKKLMSLDKRDRKMLAQGFAWYMQHGSYNRTKGETVKLISNISGFPAAKQVVLYDEIYTAAKTALKNYKISQKTYKLVSGGNSHQPIAVFKVVADFEPIKKSVSVKDFDSTTQKVNLKIDKIDAVKRTGLPNATFKVTCDGKEVAQITTGEGGSIDYTYSRKLTTKTYTVSKSYIENWDDLDSTQRKKLTQNGYYQNKSAAIKAGRAELKKKLTAELNSLKSKTHTWKIEEVKAPFGHKVSNSIQTATEKSQNKYLYFQFTDLPEKRTLTIQKDSETGEYGVEATLANAVYGLYAAENILDTDNKTVLYKADEKVTELTTDKDGQATVSELKPGKYYLQEIEAPEGYLLSDKKYPVDLSSSDQTEDVTDTLITGRILIHKTYGTEKLPEKSAEFILYNSNNETVDTLTIDENGDAQSKELPYGNYRIEQTKGMDGYAFLPTQIIKIDGSKAEYTISANDEPEYAGIAISKTIHCDDQETNSVWNEAEKDAEFEIQDASGKTVETLVTDEHGFAVSGELQPGTYTVHQTKGAENYEKVKDFQVTIKAGDHKILQYDLADENIATKIRLKKVTVKDEEETEEAEAKFIILDQSLAKDIDKADLSTGTKRRLYTLSLPREAIVGRMTTDKNGEASMLLNKLDAGKKFIVLQWAGADGYALMDPYYSEKDTPVMENGHPTYTIQGKDEFEDYAYIKIKKSMVTDRVNDKAVTEAERDAEFEIIDMNGDTVETRNTNESGEAVSGKLPYGTYMIHQISGNDTHELAEDQEVTLSKSNKKEPVTVSFENEEKPVEVILTKRSSETQILLSNASYDIYNEKGEKVASITTGEEKEGVASCKLPYGKYYLKETVSPDGYKCSKVEFVVGTKYEADDFTFKLVYDDGSEKEVAVTDKEVEIDPDTASPVGEQQVGFTFKSGECFKFGSAETTVKVVDAPDADKSQPEDVEVNLDVEDTLITHTIRIAKEDESGNPVAGATFGLYAAKDIIAKNGNVLFRVNELIAMAKSELTSEGDAAVVTFSNLPSDLNASGSGRMYYVREIQAAPGYAIGEMSGKTLGYSGSVESYNGEVAGVIHDYEKSGIIADIAYKNEYSAVTNKKLTKVVLQKIWDDENNVGNRPKSITIRATNGSQTKDYTLTAENNWMIETDIPVEEIDDWEFEELSFNGSDKYNTSQKKDPETNVITFTNKLKKVYKNFVVQKVWDDGDDQDGIRPESVKVNLYRNGKYFDSTELNESNNWKDNTKFRRLDAENDEGVEYTYEIKEESTDLINGNSKTGYEISYAEEDQTDTDGTAYTNVAITNTHVPGKSKIVIHKKIDGDVNWNLGNPEFTFLITGTTLQGDDVKLRKKITFNKDEIEQLLSESKDGKVTKDLIFDDLDPGTYTVTEEDDNPYYELEKIESTDTGISIDKNKITYQLGRKDGSLAGRTKDGEVTFYNKERSGSVEINKKDDSGKALESVGFALYDQDHNLIQSGKTDTDGKLKFTGLPIGSYWLEETNTVSGKNKLSKALKITVPLQMTQDEVDAKKADTSKGIKIGGEYYFYQLTYDITNSAILNIPKAGALEQYPWLLPAMICIALGLVGMRNRKRKGSEQDEKEQEK